MARRNYIKWSGWCSLPTLYSAKLLFRACCNECGITTTTTRYLKNHINSVELYKVVLPLLPLPTLYSPKSFSYSSTFQPPSDSTFKLHVLVTQPISVALELLQVGFFTFLLLTYYARRFFLLTFIYKYIYSNTHQHLYCQNPLFPKLCNFKLLTNTPDVAVEAC